MWLFSVAGEISQRSACFATLRGGASEPQTEAVWRAFRSEKLQREQAALRGCMRLYEAPLSSIRRMCTLKASVHEAPFRACTFPVSWVCIPPVRSECVHSFWQQTSSSAKLILNWSGRVKCQRSFRWPVEQIPKHPNSGASKLSIVSVCEIALKAISSKTLQ